MNLNELLCNIDQLAEDGLEIPEQTMEELKDKIDSYYNAVKTLEALANHLGDEVARVQARKKTVENNVKRLREYLLFNMKSFGWNEIKGQSHKAKVVNSKKFVIHHTPEMYIDHEFVISKTFYEFDKEKLKSLYEADPKKFEGVCEIEEKETVRLT